MPQIKKVIDSIVSLEKGTKVAVPLSGGLDSNAILFSCVDLGIDCVAFSFRMDSHESRDFKAARANAKALNVPFVEITIPSSVESIKADLITLQKRLGCKKKTDFECSRVMLYLYEAVNRAGIKTIISGLGAEAVYLETRKAVVHYKHIPDQYRKMMKTRVGEKECLQLKQHEYLTKEYDIRHVMPYVSAEMFDAFEGFSWDECMKGTFKKPAKRDYKDYLSTEGVRVYSPQGYQLGDTGIAASFEQLLDSDWNTRDSKSVTAIYNDLVKGLLE
ncbi:asparagine synthase-related protein [Vibrio crassostreae]|uniref:asparagine synthase-related protein n=1 Tax=Vibrio crassostreae TaxID=246167 RepID=UPI001B30B24D|nr:asparagine synthase-related protein [Vibrio crassostreae]